MMPDNSSERNASASATEEKNPAGFFSSRDGVMPDSIIVGQYYIMPREILVSTDECFVLHLVRPAITDTGISGKLEQFYLYNNFEQLQKDTPKIFSEKKILVRDTKKALHIISQDCGGLPQGCYAILGCFNNKFEFFRAEGYSQKGCIEITLPAPTLVNEVNLVLNTKKIQDILGPILFRAEKYANDRAKEAFTSFVENNEQISIHQGCANEEDLRKAFHLYLEREWKAKACAQHSLILMNGCIGTLPTGQSHQEVTSAHHRI
jgi:hypothetical protein